MWQPGESHCRLHMPAGGVPGGGGEPRRHHQCAAPSALPRRSVYLNSITDRAQGRKMAIDSSGVIGRIEFGRPSLQSPLAMQLYSQVSGRAYLQCGQFIEAATQLRKAPDAGLVSVNDT